MPAGISPNEGIGELLATILKRDLVAPALWQLGLFTNDLVPDCDTELDDLVEATFDGYAKFDLFRADWLEPTVEDCCATMLYRTGPLVWDVIGGPIETIYGYWIEDVMAGVIRFVQRFDALDIEPIQIGGKLLLRPIITLTNAECEE